MPSGSDLSRRAEAFAQPRKVFMLGRKPRRIDLLTTIDGIDFERAARDHLMVVLGGARVPVIAREPLLINKRASGRPKDMADVAALERTKR